MRLVTGQPPGFTLRAISQNGQNRKFSACRALKKAAGQSILSRKLPRPILKTEIVRRTESAYWVAIAACLVQPLIKGLRAAYFPDQSSQTVHVLRPLHLAATRNSLTASANICGSRFCAAATSFIAALLGVTSQTT